MHSEIEFLQRFPNGLDFAFISSLTSSLTGATLWKTQCRPWNKCQTSDNIHVKTITFDMKSFYAWQSCPSCFCFFLFNVLLFLLKISFSFSHLMHHYVHVVYYPVHVWIHICSCFLSPWINNHYRVHVWVHVSCTIIQFMYEFIYVHAWFLSKWINNHFKTPQ